MQKDSKPTQNEIIGQKLVDLAENISVKDRREYLTLMQGKIKSSTLYKYLSGHVSDPETGLGILLWFSSKVKKRQETLEQIS